MFTLQSLVTILIILSKWFVAGKVRKSPKKSVNSSIKRTKRYLHHFRHQPSFYDANTDYNYHGFPVGKDVARLSYLTEKYGHDLSEDIDERKKDVEEIGRQMVENSKCTLLKKYYRVSTREFNFNKGVEQLRWLCLFSFWCGFPPKCLLRFSQEMYRSLIAKCTAVQSPKTALR